MPILRKRITPEFLPILGRAQWALAADIMRRANGGDLISKTSLRHFRFLAECTDDLVKLQRLTGSQEIHIVSFYDGVNASYADRALIEWAVDDYVDSEDAEKAEDADTLYAFRMEWRQVPWQEFGK